MERFWLELNGVPKKRFGEVRDFGRIGSSQPTQKSALATWKTRCDKASDHARVMLHLRARYVSKAAILTIPADAFAGRKSKSRLNSKGLGR